MFSQLSCSNFQRCTALVGCFAFALLSSSSHTSSIGLRSGDWGGHAGHYFEMSGIFLFHQIVLAIILCMFWGRCLVGKQRIAQPAVNLMEWRVSAVCHAVIAMLVENTMNMIQIANSFSSKTSPDHDTASPVFDSGNNTCRTHALALSASHKHSTV